jgi:hypothetical protein
MIEDYEKQYCLADAYFCRTTIGCIRRCSFCAVPRLEPHFREITGWNNHIEAIRERFGERQHLVFLDNNFLATRNLESTISEIRDKGFGQGAKLNNHRRRVDFTQGIDHRLITRQVAKQLSTINLYPVRIAFDSLRVEKAYRRAISYLSDAGLSKFTNYMLYNFRDDPRDFEVSGFPMRYIPINAIKRGYVGRRWKWRYLRSIQCVLVATKGLISPNPRFIYAAFGKNVEEFLEILAMPDHYIIKRNKYKNNGTRDWRKRFRRLSSESKGEFLGLLEKLHFSPNREADLRNQKRFRDLLKHYYPNGKSAPKE